jgi:hypothetical protein
MASGVVVVFSFHNGGFGSSLMLGTVSDSGGALPAAVPPEDNVEEGITVDVAAFAVEMPEVAGAEEFPVGAVDVRPARSRA